MVTDPAENPGDKQGNPPISQMTGSDQLLGDGGLYKNAAFSAPTHPGILAVLDGFEILQKLGAGGMGIVLLARDTATGTLVAIKMLRPDLAGEPRIVHRFLTEAMHMRRMSHPHILKLLDVRERAAAASTPSIPSPSLGQATSGLASSGLAPYYVMPFLKRGSLATVMRPHQPLDPALTLSICCEVASALSYAHSQGVIHRDLKPANILLDDQGRAYLSDFGLVRTVFNDSIVEVGKSQCEGTAAYMSPAVALGQAEDTRCDIYSFGAMLYEMLTGEQPYEGRSPDAVTEQIRAGPPVAILQRAPTAPSGLVVIAEHAMARELRDRYASMADIVADLDRVAARAAPIGPHDRPEKRSSGKLGRKWMMAAAILAIALGVGLVVRFAITARVGTDTSTGASPHAQPAAPTSDRPFETARNTPVSPQPPISPLPATGPATQITSPLDGLPDKDGLVVRLTGHAGRVQGVGFFADGRRVLSRSIEDASVRLWDVPESRLVKIFQAGQALNKQGKRTSGPWALSPDQTRVVAGRTVWQIEGLISIQSVDHADPTLKSPDHVLPCSGGCAISPDNRLVFFGSNLTVYDLAQEGRPVRTLGTYAAIFPFFSRDGRYLMLTDLSDNAVHVHRVSNWELLLNTGKNPNLAPTSNVSRRQIRGCGFSPDGNRILAALEDGTAGVFEIESGAEVVRVQDDSSVKGALFSPDGTRIVSFDENGLYVNDAKTGARLASLHAPPDKYVLGNHQRIVVACYSPSGKRILSQNGGTICLWDADSGHLIRAFVSHAGMVMSLAFSPDGRYAVSGGDDKSLRIWRLPG